MVPPKIQSTLNEYLHYDLLTIEEAAKLLGKSIHNINYLISYKKINRFDSNGKIISKSLKQNKTYVSKSELLEYWKSWENRLKQRRKLLNIFDDELAFYDVTEKERTKHVHRLHPYLGKFIPQLVEYYFDKYFSTSKLILDPFMGSGTTLVVAEEKGINSIGIDISEFNSLIAKSKLTKYDISQVENEIIDIYTKTEEYSKKLDRYEIKKETLETNSEYLESWFAKRTLLELFFYRDRIKDYSYQDILKIILTRAARSSRLVHHYDIATPKNPITEPYICRKHQNKVCNPIDRAIGKIRNYSFDTITRLKDFSMLRKNTKYTILNADSRNVNLSETIKKNRLGKIDGIFTSPPYVGQIDYHEQHRYAYELLNIPRNDENEIGRKKIGKSKNAQDQYQEGITKVFLNVGKYLDDNARIFIVANDRLNLYPKIIDDSGLKLINVRERPVEARTEKDRAPYSEKIFECTIK